MQTFKLVPYPANELPKIEIVGEITRVKNQLSIHYSVQGEIKNLLLRGPSTPARKNDLWRATCFEFFLAMPNKPAYWEFNMSPSGEWNVYYMDAYRQVNMREEATICQLPFAFQNGDNVSLDISVDLNPIIQADPKIQVGIAAIVQTKDGSETYWALSHPGEHADFHLRDSFVLGV